MRSIRTVVDKLVFAEGPRWHEGALYISDMHGQRVLKLDEGAYEVVAQIDDATSGLGWLPDGRLLVVAMQGRKVMRQERDGRMVEHADLNDVATFNCNDMIVAAGGTAYVGNFGFPIFPLGDPKPAKLARIAPDGTVSVAADELWFPNGIALTDSERTLIVAESAAFCLTAYTIGVDGELSDRRIWAALGESNAPDGICIDSEGGAWVAIPHHKKFIRVLAGGEVTETIEVADHALACALGGPDRRTLYMTTSLELEPEKCLSNPTASVLASQVDLAGSGNP